MSGLLVTEWIERSGGAERVLDVMGNAFPDADIRCLWSDPLSAFPTRQLDQSWLARTPLRRHKALALPLMPTLWRHVNAEWAYDWMLVSSYVFAHHVRLVGQDIPKYVYAHTPARYIWNPELDRRGDNPLVRTVAPIFRSIDRRRAQEATAIAANSEFVRDRIRRAWDRDATVIHPPVAVERILSRADWRTGVTDDEERRIIDRLPDSYVLGASRFIPYKRLDLVIESAARVGLPAVIAGSGPDEERLRAVAARVGVPVLFVIAPSDAMLYALMQRAAVFVFPAVEDFGIVPVEAQAAGVPVVTGPVGGQIETYVDGVSGITAASTDAADLADAISAAIFLPRFNARTATARFHEDIFTTKIRRFVGIEREVRQLRPSHSSQWPSSRRFRPAA
ncbi:glycosyltransferase [Microbacterium murale]|uniref:D-inositol 3-phosphate glycosyltransferase n=1 Tax=Microbacterium murale TaxID=1081040 RepID=A0ABU0PB79_9MICO|nr:glycosyltransferase [Microbacterium murale]MDQ0644594.1 glycosyltransferase involved in cell wall biosynthesis [Microbacterium murale]